MHALDELRRGLIRGVALAGTLSAAAMGLVYVYTVWLAVQGHLSVGDVVLYGGAVTLLQAELGALARAAGYLPQSCASCPVCSACSRPLPICRGLRCRALHPAPSAGVLTSSTLGSRTRARHAGAAGRLVLHSAGRVRGARWP